MKKIVSLKLYEKSFVQLLSMGRTVSQGFKDNSLIYSSPFPTTIILDAKLDALESAIEKWGEEGNRGSHQEWVELTEARDEVRTLLTQLKAYAEDTTPYSSELGLIGWDLKAASSKIGTFDSPTGLRQVVNKKVLIATIRLRWKKPSNARKTKVSYIVMRSVTGSYSDATQVGVVTNTVFVDTNPGVGYRFYWVIPIDGSISDVCQAIAKPMP